MLKYTTEKCANVTIWHCIPLSTRNAKMLDWSILVRVLLSSATVHKHCIWEHDLLMLQNLAHVTTQRQTKITRLPQSCSVFVLHPALDAAMAPPYSDLHSG